MTVSLSVLPRHLIFSAVAGSCLFSSFRAAPLSPRIISTTQVVVPDDSTTTNVFILTEKVDLPTPQSSDTDRRSSPPSGRSDEHVPPVLVTERAGSRRSARASSCSVARRRSPLPGDAGAGGPSGDFMRSSRHRSLSRAPDRGRSSGAPSSSDSQNEFRFTFRSLESRPAPRYHHALRTDQELESLLLSHEIGTQRSIGIDYVLATDASVGDLHSARLGTKGEGSIAIGFCGSAIDGGGASGAAEEGNKENVRPSPSTASAWLEGRSTGHEAQPDSWTNWKPLLHNRVHPIARRKSGVSIREREPSLKRGFKLQGVAVDEQHGGNRKTKQASSVGEALALLVFLEDDRYWSESHDGGIVGGPGASNVKTVLIMTDSADLLTGLATAASVKREARAEALPLYELIYERLKDRAKQITARASPSNSSVVSASTSGPARRPSGIYLAKVARESQESSVRLNICADRQAGDANSTPSPRKLAHNKTGTEYTAVRQKYNFAGINVSFVAGRYAYEKWPHATEVQSLGVSFLSPWQRQRRRDIGFCHLEPRVFGFRLPEECDAFEDISGGQRRGNEDPQDASDDQRSNGDAKRFIWLARHLYSNHDLDKRRNFGVRLALDSTHDELITSTNRATSFIQDVFLRRSERPEQFWLTLDTSGRGAGQQDWSTTLLSSAEHVVSQMQRTLRWTSSHNKIGLVSNLYVRLAASIKRDLDISDPSYSAQFTAYMARSLDWCAKQLTNSTGHRVALQRSLTVNVELDPHLDPESVAAKAQFESLRTAVNSWRSLGADSINLVASPAAVASLSVNVDVPLHLESDDPPQSLSGERVKDLLDKAWNAVEDGKSGGVSAEKIMSVRFPVWLDSEALGLGGKDHGGEQASDSKFYCRPFVPRRELFSHSPPEPARMPLPRFSELIESPPSSAQSGLQLLDACRSWRPQDHRGSSLQEQGRETPWAVQRTTFLVPLVLELDMHRDRWKDSKQRTKEFLHRVQDMGYDVAIDGKIWIEDAHNSSRKDLEDFAADLHQNGTRKRIPIPGAVCEVAEDLLSAEVEHDLSRGTSLSWISIAPGLIKNADFPWIVPA